LAQRTRRERGVGGGEVGDDDDQWVPKRLDAKETGIECMAPLDVLASIHFQWAMHDEGHKAERQAKGPTHVREPYTLFVQGTKPVQLGVLTLLTTVGIHRETKLSCGDLPI
jgi:hypothetical protein